MKNSLKGKAIELRGEGLSYNEILRQVPVAKSTLSLWLRSIGIAKRQKQKLTERRLAAIRRGRETWKNQRIKKTKAIKLQASLDITEIDGRDLWLMGIMLYWAEGAKQKDHDPSQGVLFSNSDPFMIKIFLIWLKTCLKISNNDIAFDICVHETHKDKLKTVSKYWATITGFSEREFGRIYLKKHKLINNRKNIGKNYYGQLRIRVKKSTDLNRKILGWIEGICQHCGVV